MQAALSIPALSREAARKIGLRYVSDREPGIIRKPAGGDFKYFDAKGSPVRDAATLKRIRSLVIPPAWTDVWICLREDGHLQAVGRDARHRKQYRYHKYYRQMRDETKFNRMAAFGAALPKIRAQVHKDLNSRGMCKQKILAAIVQLLDSVAIRIGNEDYARQNESFGLTTMRNNHVEVTGQTIHFHFRGKSGQLQKMKLTDRRLAAIVRKCQCLPGQELFLYEDADGQIVKIHSEDVNEYLEGLAKEKFTAKDFRTWKGTTEMILALQQLGPAHNETEAKKNITEAVKITAQKLGNRPPACRGYYIHPAIPAAYMDGSLFQTLDHAQKIQTSETGLRPEERAALGLVHHYRAPQIPKLKDAQRTMSREAQCNDSDAQNRVQQHLGR
ncbi:MAG: DNA topoisomerase IB [Acidobacteriota bacterium]|nr:DNA topoisomerase IB [Acidobacteriota bacterium]